MPDSMTTADLRPLDRINLRLPGPTFEEIDAARASRPGHVSRNTWITKAILEKLERDQTEVAAPAGARLRHG